MTTAVKETAQGTLKEPTLEREEVSGVLVVAASTGSNRAAGGQGSRSDEVQQLLARLPEGRNVLS